jgi:hypothetical protein
MSLEWPAVVLEDDVLSSLPPSRMSSSALKRACRRYVVAMSNVNKQVVAYNTDVHLHRLQTALTHEELRAMMQQYQCMLAPFVSVPVNTLSPVMPQLITLHRAFQCAHVLKDTLESWDAPPLAATNETWPNPGPPPSGAPFSLFSASIV